MKGTATLTVTDAAGVSRPPITVSDGFDSVSLNLWKTREERLTMNILELTMSPTIAEWPEMADGRTFGPARAVCLRVMHGLSAPTPHSKLALARVQMGDADKAFGEALERAYGREERGNARYDYRNGTSAELRRKRDAFIAAKDRWHGLEEQIRAQSLREFRKRVERDRAARRSGIQFVDGGIISRADLPADVLEDLTDCAGVGCAESVAYFVKTWAPSGDAGFIRDYLKESGGWMPEELGCDASNLERMVWLCACHVREEGAFICSVV